MRWALPSVRGPVAWLISIDRMMQLLDMLDGDVATLVRLGGARTMTATAQDTLGSWPREVVLSNAEGGRWLWLTRDVRRLHFHEAWRSTSTQEEG